MTTNGVVCGHSSLNTIEMSVKAIEMRPIAAALPSFGADNDDGGFHHDVNSASIAIDEKEASHLSKTSQTAEDKADIASNKQIVVVRKYLSMIMVAYILTLLSPGTMLWSSKSSSPIMSAPCNPPNYHTSKSNYAQSMNESAPTFTEKSAYFSNTSTTSDFDDEKLDVESASITIRNNSNESSSNDNCTMIMMDHDVGSAATTINIPLLIKLTAYTMALIFMFFKLQGSDPGIVDKVVSCRLKDGGVMSENKSDSTPARNDKHDDYNNTSIDCEIDDGGENDYDIEQQFLLDPSSRISSSKKADGGDSSHSILHSIDHHLPMVSPTQRNHRVDCDGLCYRQTRRKYCHICQIHPPIRSHHCSICHACVATFDHHCVFLETCIGERNHFRFWLLVLWNVLCLHLALRIVNSAKHGSGIGGVISALLGYHHDEYEASGQESDRIAVRTGQMILLVAKLYMYPIYVIATLLLIIHTINALGNCTTFELTKGPEHIDYLVNTRMMDFPFGNGLLNNIRVFIMRDDFVSSGWLLWWRWQPSGGMADGIRVGQHVEMEDATTTTAAAAATTTNSNAIDDEEFVWVPIVWKLPTYIDRESEDWWNHMWQNKYWSCC